MKAIQIHEFGGPDVLRLEEIDDPKPGANEVTVRIRAAGVNPVETYQRAGSQGYQRETPFGLGADGAGVVEAVGDGVDLAPGTRVYTAGSLTGTYAELALCSGSQVHPLPESLSFEEGACLWINYGTAYRALFQRGGAVAGETVLIHGATGGVGVAALEWARHRGVRTIASYGSAEGKALVESLGADVVVDHGDPDHGRAVLDATGGSGVNLVIEMLANRNLDTDLDLVARRGRVVVVGSRGSLEFTPRKTMGKEADVRGLMLYGANDAELREIHAAIAAAARAGSIKPVIQRSMPLAEAGEAHRAVIEDRSHGKIVLVP